MSGRRASPTPDPVLPEAPRRTDSARCGGSSAQAPSPPGRGRGSLWAGQGQLSQTEGAESRAQVQDFCPPVSHQLAPLSSLWGWGGVDRTPSPPRPWDPAQPAHDSAVDVVTAGGCAPRKRQGSEGHPLCATRALSPRKRQGILHSVLQEDALPPPRIPREAPGRGGGRPGPVPGASWGPAGGSHTATSCAVCVSGRPRLPLQQRGRCFWKVTWMPP